MAQDTLQPRDWPTTLPECVWPARSLLDDYALKAQLPDYSSNPSIPFCIEQPDIQKFFMQEVHLGRGLEYPSPVKKATYDGAMDTLHGFLGFMFKVGAGSGRASMMHLV